MRRGVMRAVVVAGAGVFMSAPLAAVQAERTAALPAPCNPAETTNSVGLAVYTFTSMTECSFTPPASLVGATVSMIAVGGGGGGAANGGGGGGGGELRQTSRYTVPANGAFVVRVGIGGTKGTGTGIGPGVLPGFGGQSSIAVSVNGAVATDILRSVGGAGGVPNTAGPADRAATGSGGTGGTQAPTGRGGTPSSPVTQGLAGENGFTWPVTSDTFGGGGGGGICAVLPVLPINIDPPSGGATGGGAGAGKRPGGTFSSDGSAAMPNTGSGGGGGAGCSGALAGGAATSSNGGEGGSGVVVMVVTAAAAPTTTAAATTTTNPRLALSGTTTTVAGVITPVATTLPRTTLRTPTTLAGTTVSPVTGLVGTTTTAVTGTVPGATLLPSATTLPTGTPTDVRNAVSATTVPEVVPGEPVFFSSVQEPAQFFDIDFGVVAGAPAPGATVNGSARGLTPGSTIRAVLRSDPVVLAEFTAGTDGRSEFSLTLPDEIAAGTHTLTFEAVSLDGTPVSSVTAFSVNDAGITAAVVEAAEIVGTTVDLASVERSVEAQLPVYDTERHVSRTAAIAATVVVATSLAGIAATQVTGGLVSTGTVAGTGSQSPPAGGGPGNNAGRIPEGRREDEPEEMEEPDEFEGTEANLLDELDDDRVGRGDRRGLWQLPGYAPVDRFLRRAVPVAASRSILGTRILQDGHWLRASTGVVSPLLWIVGLLVGALSAAGLPGVVTAPDGAAITMLVLLSMLDAMTGAAGWFGFAAVALVTGNVTGVFDVRTLLGLGVVLVALPSIGSNIRPFSRPWSRERSALADRLGDYLVMPVLLAFIASSAYAALNGLSGLEMVDSSDTGSLFVTVLVGAWLRLLGEDAVVAWFPQRSQAVRVPVAHEPTATARFATVATGAVLYLLAAAPFFGLGWRTWLTIALVSLVPLLQLAEHRVPNLETVHRWFPRGLLRFVVMMFVTAWFGRFVLSLADEAADPRSVAVFMLLPGVLVGLVDLVGREGGEWRDSRLKNAAGLAVWLLAVAVLSGRVTL